MKLLKPVLITSLTVVIAAFGFMYMYNKPNGKTMKTYQEIASYAIGHNIGNQVKTEKELFEVDLDLLVNGLKDAFNDIDSPLSGEELTEAFGKIQELADARQKKLSESAGEDNVKFLAENGKKDGVITLESGLQYEVITKGEGTEKPSLSDQVKTHYHGTLINGTVFDSSVERNEPITFPVGGVIKGWIEALQLMVEGDKWRLTVPSELAYGGAAQGQIPANSVLIFEVELIEIIK